MKVDAKIDGGHWLEIKRHLEVAPSSFSPCSSDKSVIQIPVAGWLKFPSKNMLAMFNYGHVYFYLVESLKDIQVDGFDGM